MQCSQVMFNIWTWKIYFRKRRKIKKSYIYFGGEFEGICWNFKNFSFTFLDHFEILI